MDLGELAGAGLEGVSDRDVGLALLDTWEAHPLDFQAQLEAFREVLANQKRDRQARQVEIDKLDSAARRSSDLWMGQHISDEYGAELLASIYQDAVHSMAVIGMLGPLVESVFNRVFCGLHDRYAESSWQMPDHPRWSMSARWRWDCRRNQRGQRSITEGIIELVEATGFRSYLPPTFEMLLRAIFRYRNVMFHQGLEWPAEELERFNQCRAEWPEGWFDNTERAGKASFFYPSDAFVEACLAMAETVVVGLGKYVLSANERRARS